MKQISQNYRSGEIRLETVAPPALKAGGVLVRTSCSAVSTGTEGMKVKEARMSYVGKARARPDQVEKVVASIRQQGLAATYRKVMHRLDSLTPLGYSTSGIVAAVGRGAEEFSVGQRVACAGAGYANHSEINFVPKNLVVPVPEGVTMEQAAFSTIGAIAMQGFRQGETQLGETACVIGLGLIGQLLVQILRAAGARVMGVDPLEDRCARARKFGAAYAGTPEDPDLRSAAERISGGIGVDCVFISAGARDDGPVRLAVDVARDRGRVVDIGKTLLDLPWNDCYRKELDVRFSRSYGPGRYDPVYEEEGVDYPVGYVRWTERRNMSAFLDLMASGRVSVAGIVDTVTPFDESTDVYRRFASGQASELGVVFKYGNEVDVCSTPPVDGSNRQAARPPAGPNGALGLGVIGTGNYASSMLLPELSKNRSVALKEIAAATSLSTANAGRRFDVERLSTDYTTLLSAADITAVVIATRHSQHAQMADEALRTGKAVYVEKPLAIDLKGLEVVRRAVIETGNDRLMVGFNRRFSPMIRKTAEIVQRQNTPPVMHYRVHAGQLETGSWYLDSSTQGSRFVGEAGHFFDVFSYLTNSRPVSVVARCLRPATTMSDDLENVAVTVEYENGAVGNLLYLTRGGPKLEKEFLEIHVGGRTIQMHNFDKLVLYQDNSRKKIMSGPRDKGQVEQMNEFVSAVRDGEEMPIPLESILDTTLLTLAAWDSMRARECIELRSYFKMDN